MLRAPVGRAHREEEVAWLAAPSLAPEGLQLPPACLARHAAGDRACAGSRHSETGGDTEPTQVRACMMHAAALLCHRAGQGKPLLMPHPAAGWLLPGCLPRSKAHSPGTVSSSHPAHVLSPDLAPPVQAVHPAPRHRPARGPVPSVQQGRHANAAVARWAGLCCQQHQSAELVGAAQQVRCWGLNAYTHNPPLVCGRYHACVLQRVCSRGLQQPVQSTAGVQFRWGCAKLERRGFSHPLQRRPLE